MFSKYTSIENPSSKYVSSARRQGYTDSTIEWVAMEKIHGSNFSFICDGENVQIAKRTSLIQNENFYGSNILYAKYFSAVLQLYQKIKLEWSSLKQIQIYGEIFGGIYPGQKSDSSAKIVQKGIYYHPNNEFLVFDIKINIDEPDTSKIIVKPSDSNSHKSENQTENEKIIGTEKMGKSPVKAEWRSFFLSYTELESLLQDSLLKIVPFITKGKSETLLNLSPKFDSNIYELYGLPKVKNNLAEGLVIKANCRHPIELPRPIFKIKNKNFHEVVKKQSNIHTNIKKPDIVNEIVSNYCTQNRFNNIISKNGLEKPLESLQWLLTIDMVEDYQKELEGEKLDMLRINMNKIKSAVKSQISKSGVIDTWLVEFNTSEENTNL